MTDQSLRLDFLSFSDFQTKRTDKMSDQSLGFSRIFDFKQKLLIIWAIRFWYFSGFKEFRFLWPIDFEFLQEPADFHGIDTLFVERVNF